MRLKPRQPDPFNVMGNVCTMRGEVSKAIERYTQAVALSPKNGSTAVFPAKLERPDKIAFKGRRGVAKIVLRQIQAVQTAATECTRAKSKSD